MTEWYEEYRLLFTFPSGRGGSRTFDWADFDILSESNEMTVEEIKAIIKDRGRFTGFWGSQKCGVIRESSKRSATWVQKVRREMK